MRTQVVFLSRNDADASATVAAVAAQLGFAPLERAGIGTIRAFEASALNHPAVLLVEAPEARHEEQAWAARFPAAIKFLFPKPSTELPKEKNP